MVHWWQIKSTGLLCSWWLRPLPLLFMVFSCRGRPICAFLRMVRVFQCPWRTVWTFVVMKWAFAINRWTGSVSVLFVYRVQLCTISWLGMLWGRWLLFPYCWGMSEDIRLAHKLGQAGSRELNRSFVHENGWLLTMLVGYMPDVRLHSTGYAVASTQEPWDGEQFDLFSNSSTTSIQSTA